MNESSMKEITCPNCHQTFRMDGSGYAQIIAQIRDDEFEKQLASLSRSSVQERELELERLHMSELQKRDEQNRKLSSEIERLTNQLAEVTSNLKRNVEFEVQKVSSQKDLEIERLKGSLEKSEADKLLAVQKEIQRFNEKVAEDQRSLALLKQDLAAKDSERELALRSARESYDSMIRIKDQEIAHYKEFKTRMSTKMIGESLEQHCLTLFNQIRATAFPGAYFDKDNDASAGSKGDFIFRDYKDDIEYLSIMFEMKNEMEAEDSKSSRHRNEDFFAKLDRDRREKGCEYAVLVSMLEPESELYNTGIVDVSYRYPKMYVIRPQFFIPIITILRNSALNSVSYRKELAMMRSRNIDVQNLEDKLQLFQKDFGYNVDQIGKKFEDAIKEIDKSIQAMQKTRDDLVGCQRNFRIANDKAQALDVKKLLKDSPSIARQLDKG